MSAINGTEWYKYTRRLLHNHANPKVETRIIFPFFPHALYSSMIPMSSRTTIRTEDCLFVDRAKPDTKCAYNELIYTEGELESAQQPGVPLRPNIFLTITFLIVCLVLF